MAYWKKKYRKINGHKKLVKVECGKRSKGRVRVLHHRNTTDKATSRANRRKRKRGYSNHSDRTGRNYRRRR